MHKYLRENDNNIQLLQFYLNITEDHDVHKNDGKPILIHGSKWNNLSRQVTVFFFGGGGGLFC